MILFFKRNILCDHNNSGKDSRRCCCTYICYFSLPYLPSIKSFYIPYWHHNWRKVCWKALTFATFLSPNLCSHNASSVILCTHTKCGKAVSLNTYVFQQSHTLLCSRSWKNEQKYLGLGFFCLVQRVFCVGGVFLPGVFILFSIHRFCNL